MTSFHRTRIRIATLRNLLGVLVILAAKQILFSGPIAAPEVGHSYPASYADCQSLECIRHHARSFARPWPQSPDWKNIVLIKVPKSASSTAAGVVLRMGAHRSNSTVAWEHRKASTYHHDQPNTFWLAPIRDPGRRHLSSLYFHTISFHGRRNSVPTDRFVLEKLQSADSNFIADYTSFENRTRWSEEEVESLAQSYNMLLVVERLDESLVALAFVAGVAITDVLSLSSKIGGSYYRTGRNKCIQLSNPVVTPALRDYFASPEWIRRHATDLLLHAIADLSLDATLALLPPGSVDKFRRLQKDVSEVCQRETRFPCSAEGQPQEHNCYTRDFGCGYECIDRFVSPMPAQ